MLVPGIVALLTAAIMINVAVSVLDLHITDVARQVMSQSLGYALILAIGSALFRGRYRQPFLRAVKLSRRAAGIGSAALVGFTLGLSVIVVGAIFRPQSGGMHALDIKGGFGTYWPAALLGISFGPFFEEVVFRGVLQPVVVRSLGVSLGIGIPALLYGMALIPQYGLTWNCGSVAVASATWGWVRHRTGSTTAAVVAHAAYNGTWVLLMVFSHGASG
jgi:membrane protease YdiL (CAAX protease family)